MQKQMELNQRAKDIVQGFARNLTEDGKRPKTVESYVGDTSGFLAYLAQMDTDFIGELKRFKSQAIEITS